MDRSRGGVGVEIMLLEHLKVPPGGGHLRGHRQNARSFSSMMGGGGDRCRRQVLQIHLMGEYV
jgi:hypothetical protein